MNKFLRVFAKMVTTLLLVTLTGVSYSVENTSYKYMGEKQFTLTQQFNVHHVKYANVTIQEFLMSQPDHNNGPDRATVSFLSSILQDDYAWWLSHWSEDTLSDWETKAALNRAEREFSYWKARMNSKSKVHLVDFLVVGEFAFIGMRIDGTKSVYYLMPFVFENNRWRINQLMMNSPLYRELKQQIL